MNILSSWRLVLALLAVVVSVPTVRAQAYNNPTLEKIREYGAIYVGHREASIPFSYFAGDEVVGYSKDLCDRIVDAIKEQLDDPTLKVVLVPVTSSSRMLMLMTGMIDLECGSTTNTRIRQQSVAFGVTTFVSGVKAVTRKDVGIERIVDLDGKVVVTTAGTTTERIVKTVLAARNASARPKSARTHLESLSMVVSRQADAFVLDDAILSGLLVDSPDGDKLKLLEENFGFEPYGIALRKGDPEFKKLVDATLIRMMKDGELEKLYAKWFMSPIPPKNVTLNIPMSGMLKDLLRNPSDSGI
ncbi:MAG: glutamate/aspartate transport system substrate-binding protein [Rhodocyclaceae bacterium]|nr:MAG: glutamate/aspartate transport system substrate-binding protein [Rhodocyclaceae bacterium]TND05267.1 MAG: glutamate/aspartate transport system substrate-binding protein [Rhodocyclaceae bacterium]